MVNGLGGGCQEGRTGGKRHSPSGEWWPRSGPLGAHGLVTPRGLGALSQRPGGSEWLRPKSFCPSSSAQGGFTPVQESGAGCGGCG